MHRNGPFGYRQYSIIYAIDAPEVSRIKFGITNDIGKRFRGLCGGSPVPLDLIGYVWMPGEAEAHIFEFLKEDRVHGEWFRRTHRVRSVAALIAAKRERDLAEVLEMSFITEGDGSSAMLDGDVEQYAGTVPMSGAEAEIVRSMLARSA